MNTEIIGIYLNKNKNIKNLIIIKKQEGFSLIKIPSFLEKSIILEKFSR